MDGRDLQQEQQRCLGGGCGKTSSWVLEVVLMTGHNGSASSMMLNRIIGGSAVLDPPGQDASGRAEKGMTAAWLVAWAGFIRGEWIGVHREYGLGFTKMAEESYIERQCRGSTHKGEMLVGRHGEGAAEWMGWDSLEENGTIIVEEEEFWLLQVMAISEVDCSSREDCFGFQEKKLDPLHMGGSFGFSNFRDDLSKMKKTGKGLKKLGLNWRLI